MEELLNKLIEKGWVPFGLDGVKKVIYAELYTGTYRWNFFGGGWRKWKSLRQIASKESGLWQFCVENELVKMNIGDFRRTNNFELDYIDVYQDDFQYRLIESSLKDENELEEFLLNNIKVDKKSEFEELVDRNIDVAKRLASK